MNDFLNTEFYINLSITMLLTLAAIFSDFNFDLTVIMCVTWFFFIVIHTIKLSTVKNNIRIKNIQETKSI